MTSIILESKQTDHINTTSITRTQFCQWRKTKTPKQPFTLNDESYGIPLFITYYLQRNDKSDKDFRAVLQYCHFKNTKRQQTT